MSRYEARERLADAEERLQVVDTALYGKSQHIEPEEAGALATVVGEVLEEMGEVRRLLRNGSEGGEAGE